MLLIELFYSVYKNLSWLESWDVVSRNGHCSVLGDVSCSLLSSVLDDEAAESTEIYRISLGERVLYALHERLYNNLNSCLLNAGCLSYLVYDFCLCHNYLNFNTKLINDIACKSRLIFSINQINGPKIIKKLIC